MSFSRGKQVFLLKSNERKKQDKKKKIINKEGLGPSEVSYQSKFSFVFGGCPKFPFFDNLAKKRAPKKHYKNRGFCKAFLEKQICVAKRPFLDKKIPNPEISVIIFLPFSSLSTTKNTKISRNPHFIVF